MQRSWRIAIVMLLSVFAHPAAADETCLSPFMPKITGQEDYVYVYTLGVPGLGDGNDKLVTIGASSGSAVWTRARSSSSTSRPNPASRSS